jgi:hypothetical protein
MGARRGCQLDSNLGGMLGQQPWQVHGEDDMAARRARSQCGSFTIRVQRVTAASEKTLQRKDSTKTDAPRKGKRREEGGARQKWPLEQAGGWGVLASRTNAHTQHVQHTAPQEKWRGDRRKALMISDYNSVLLNSKALEGSCHSPTHQLASPVASWLSTMSQVTQVMATPRMSMIT